MTNLKESDVHIYFSVFAGHHRDLFQIWLLGHSCGYHPNVIVGILALPSRRYGGTPIAYNSQL